MTQSDGESIVRDMVDQKIIEFDDYISLGDIAKKELEDTGDGYKIKKATYLSEKNLSKLWKISLLHGDGYTIKLTI